MTNNGKDIRCIMDDIKQIINESYMFKEDDRESISKEETVDQDLPIEVDDIKPDNVGGSQITDKFKEIRLSAIKIMGEVDPSTDIEAYKLAKTILDSCDKLFSKDKEVKKEIKNNQF